MSLATTQIRQQQLEVNKSVNIFFAHPNFTILQSVLGVSVRKRHESVQVYEAFVKDKSVAFGACDDSEMLGGGVSPKEIGVDKLNFTALIERMRNLVHQVLTHDVIVELPGSSHIKGESPDLAAYLALVGGEFGYKVAVIDFVSHFY